MTDMTLILNRRGQGTVENLMMTAVIAGLLIPIVYEFALSPLLETMQGQRQNLVDFVSQKNKNPVPSAWFAAERMAQFKEVKDIDSAKDIEGPKEIPPPGEISSPQDIKSPQAVKSPDIKPPKAIQSPQNISSPSTPGLGGGAGGTGSALGSNAQDPDFFGGDKNSGAEDSADSQNAGGSQGYGKGGGAQFDEYSPKDGRRTEFTGPEKKQDGAKQDQASASAERRDRQNLLLSATREDERGRSSPFDWWLLIKLLILGLIIFLVILIGLSNMKKR
jgi:hypothetical protein